MESLNFFTPETIIRSSGDKIRFTAVVYYDPTNPKTEARIGPYHERLAPGCFDECLSRSDSDIVCTLDHDFSVGGFLGRTPTTLEIFRTAHGIEAEVTLPKSMSQRVNEMIDRNELRGASFTARPSKHYSAYSQDGDKKVVTIRKFDELREVAICFAGAYPAAGQFKRNYSDLENEFHRAAQTKALIEKIRAGH